VNIATPTREQAIATAARILVEAVAERSSMTVLEAARAAWYPGHRLGTVEAIAELIAERRRACACCATAQNAA
jgi:hypothetical protein